MHGIGIDGGGEIGADGALSGFPGVGRAHQFAVLGDRALTFQHLHHHRPGGHELDQGGKEGALAVLGIETTGDGVAELQHFGRHDTQAVGLETGVDLADDVLAYRVGLDDGKRAFNRHGGLLI